MKTVRFVSILMRINHLKNLSLQAASIRFINPWIQRGVTKLETTRLLENEVEQVQEIY